VTAPPGAEVAFRESLAQRGVSVHALSTNLARRPQLARDVEAALRDGCDVFLTELKAAAIDVVAEAAATAGVRMVFLRNRPVAQAGEAPLDDLLLELAATARTRVVEGVAEARS
jgi:predicted GTPase